LIHAIGAREACGRRPRGIPMNWGSIVRRAAIVIGVAFAASAIIYLGFFDMRDLAQVLDHEEPLPHPARDQVQ
jgi:hypothetical protein